MLTLLLSLALAQPCATHQDAVITPVGAFQFTYGTADLIDSDDVIASVVCALEADTALTVQVETHTDSRGSGSYNLRISQLRADAIRQALIDAGVDGQRLTAVGYGETMPLAPNEHTTGRTQNRRIELHTEPASGRPPRPKGATPQPLPKPEPQGDPWCHDLSAAIAEHQPADWPRQGALSAASQRMAACLNDSWTQHPDGDALYAEHPSWSLRVVSRDGAVVVVLTPR